MHFFQVSEEELEDMRERFAAGRYDISIEQVRAALHLAVQPLKSTNNPAGALLIIVTRPASSVAQRLCLPCSHICLPVITFYP